MIIRSKAPLRLGLAGGGTDVSPFSDIYGGAIMNATISMYAYATIRPLNNGMIVLNSINKNEKFEYSAEEHLEINGILDLHKGVYNRVVRDFIKKPLSFELTTWVDAPPGSGLGTSSTLVVAILGAFTEWMGLPLGDYDLAHLAFEIERIDLEMAGGKQDQYAATFGGFNYMEFMKEKVVVNPLRVKEICLDELAHNLLLYHTETSHLSSAIIKQESKNVVDGNVKTIEAMHKLKEQAVMMKEAILTGTIDRIGEILDFGWQYKKNLANGVTNSFLDDIYEAAMKHGATGGKVSGAGGGGFMFFYCPGNSRIMVTEALKAFGGQTKRYEFTGKGLKTWKIG